MNWEAIGAVGEIVGALAVVLSLVYLAIQVRQNSNMARAESRLRLVANFREFSNALKGKDVTAFGSGQLPDIRTVFLMDSAGDKATAGAQDGSI